MLRKRVYPYEYMDKCEKCNEIKLPTVEEVYSNLTIKDITDEDYKHAKKVWKSFELKI